MAATRGVTVDNNFIGGLITQATGLNFPENACIEEDNCIFNERGFVFRRPSFDFEANYQHSTVNDFGVFSTYVWRNATDDGTVDLVVVQTGRILTFYNTSSPLGLSIGLQIDTVDLGSFLPGGSSNNLILNNYECQFSSGFGRLFVTHPYCNSFAVTFNGTNITAASINIKVRDFEGTTDTVTSVSQRPATLSNPHQYNLLNQGWDSSKWGTFFTAAGSTYPSNADVWWIFKNSTDIFDPATTLNSNTRGNAQSPKGHFILDAFNLDRSTVSGVGGIAVVSSNFVRPSTTAFFAGRVFYAGVNAAGFTGNIYFSQIITSDADFGKCYQEADPTSEDVFALAPSDGGVIRIPGTGTIYKLVNLSNYLVVFAANGVWLLTGSQGVGFSANDYSVQLLGNIRSISGTSFVDIQGYPAWWNIDGIYVIKPDPQSGALTISSLTDDKIKDFFLLIPFLSKKTARGSYNPFTHIVQWLYRDTSAVSIDDTYAFDKILNFNILTGSFYTWTISKPNVATTAVKVRGTVGANTGGSSVINIFNVVDNSGNLVVDNLSNQVVTYGLGLGETIHTTTKYFITYTNQQTWGECANFRGDFTDWKTFDNIGEDYTSFFITGFKVHSEGQRRFQGNYIYVFSDNVEDTSYRFQSIWDFANDPDSNRWSSAQLIDHKAGLTDFIRKKIKVRGHGISVQFKYTSIPGKDFNLIGWSTQEEAAQHG